MTNQPFQAPLIVYADFDGVFHPNRAFIDRHGRVFLNGEGKLFQWTYVLASALATVPDVQIVFSTSWVRVKSYSYAKNQLPDFLRSKVIGATWHSDCKRDSDLHAWWDQATRWETIRADLDRRQPAGWMAIDDDVSDWPDAFQSHLVATDEEEGLGSEWAQRRLKSVLKDLTTGRLKNRPEALVGPAGSVLWNVPRPASNRRTAQR